MSISVSVVSPKQHFNAIIVAITAKEVSGALRSSVHDALASYSKGVDIVAFFKGAHFTGKAGQSCLQIMNGTPVVFVGLGELDKKPFDNMETLRRALGTGYNQMQNIAPKDILVCVPEEELLSVSRATYLEQVATLLCIASYQFNDFKKEKKSWVPALYIADTGKGDVAALDTGVIIGSATNVARRLADTPPNHMYPAILAERARQIASEHKLTYTVIEQEEAREMGMGCFYSVAKGSENPGKIVILEYKPKNKKAPIIGLAGKGVCFDTGGISLKPSNAMGGMKYDMSGAAAVFATMQIIAQIKPEVGVVAIAPLVENMPSGKASKQDDVVTAMNGVQVEIENTDAEGRLILSDALCYLQKKYDPAVVIDIATLTGSCMMTFGPLFAGLMTRDEALAAELKEVSYFVGDRVWPLPLVDEYKPAIESTVADITNCGSQTYKSGAITAAMFLECFIDKGRRWAHLDIAGTDAKIPGTTYLGKGATGTGVRILVEYIRRYQV